MKQGDGLVRAIIAYDAKLDPVRLALKYHAMRHDAFAFFRATCHLFYAQLPKLGRLLGAPPAWCCGDLHLANFGSYKSSAGLVYFDLNDFDEALLAPCIWDGLRACASIAAAHHSLKLDDQQRGKLMRAFVNTYGDTLARGRIGWIERDAASGVVGELISQLRGLTRKELLDRRTFRLDDSRRIQIDGDHAMEATKAEAARITAMLGQWVQAQDAAATAQPGFFDVVDVAHRVAGLGSLGVERYVVLVKGKGAPDHMRLLDVKRARPSSSIAASRTRQPAFDDQATRVAAVQNLMQAQTPAYLGTIADRSRSYVVRQLQPREDRLDLSRLGRNPEELATAVTVFAQLLAWGQLRAAGRRGAATGDALIEFGLKSKWRASLVEAATKCAARAQEDWEDFCRNYDRGAFR